MLMEKDIGGTMVCCTEAKQLWWASCAHELRRFGSWQRWHVMTQDPSLEHHISRSLSKMSGTTWYVFRLRSPNVMRTSHTMFVLWLHLLFSTRRQVHPTFSAAFSSWVHPTPRHAALHRATSNATRPCLFRDAGACFLPFFGRFSKKERISGFGISNSA